MKPLSKTNLINTESLNRPFVHAPLSGIRFGFLLRKFSDLFVILGFMVFMGGGIQLLIVLRGAEGFSNLEGDLPSQLIYFTIYLISIILFVISGRHVSLWTNKNRVFWLLLLWICLSVIWSDARLITIRRIVALCGTTLFAVYLVNTFEIEKYIKLLAISLLLINISSYLAITLFPEIGIGHVVQDEWKGIFTHKNHLGKAASLSFLIFSYLMLTVKKGKWIWLLGILSSIILLYGCQSAAAIILSIFLGGLISILYLARKNPILLWFLLLGALISLFLFPLPNVADLLRYFGKDETLTGRTLLWEFCMYMIVKKPLLGYGYGAFWLGSTGPSAEAWAGLPMGMDITHAHNGFIDIALGVGGIGLALFTITYLISFIRAIRQWALGKLKFQYSIYILLLIWILFYNISELALLDRNSIFWVLFSSVAMYQAKYMRGFK